MANTLSVIFPLYNEEKRLHFTFKDILKFNKKNIFSKVEYLFIDDGSKDESSLRIANFIKKNKRKNIKYRLIKLKSNSGKGYALKIGVEKSTLKWILTLDTDISVSLDQINIWQKKYNLLSTSSDKVFFGSRSLPDSKITYKFYRKFLGIIFSNFVKFLFNTNLNDSQCGFKLYEKKAAKKIFKQLKNNGFSHDVEIIKICQIYNIKIDEIPVNWTHRKDSKLNIFIDTFKMFFELIRIKFFN